MLGGCEPKEHGVEGTRMTEKEPAKKRTRTGAAPRTTKKAPSVAATKAAPRVPEEVPPAAPRVSTEAPPAAPRGPAAAPLAAPRVLVDAPSDQCFWVNQGPILRNLRELCDALASGVSDEQFAHHVTEERNDFAAWVEVVLQDSECAQALRRARTRAAAVRALKKHVETA